jgi:4-amino-4-deoxy-L-arabinose transferase-like glycosyltransferase
MDKFIGTFKYLIAFSFILIVYFCNLFIDIMDIDATQYAAISMEMLQKSQYLEVLERGRDYLDKPPLLFWLSSLSFRLFGFSNFAYKLPAVLALIMSLYVVFKFTQLWYTKQKAYLAAFVLGSTQAYMLMTNDVRTDGILTAFTIFTVWQICLFLKKEKIVHLLLTGIGLALALMSKGPLAFVIVTLAIGSDLLLKRDWAAIFKPQWLVALAITLLLLVPMCYGLYNQYDLHPEKIVYNLKGPSGLKFFFWTQSFGRITGDIYWENDLGPYFFLHSILWDFMPWILFMLPALYFKCKHLWAAKFKPNSSQEFITLFGFVLSFWALSTSRFKLPHYIFPLLPFLATMVADYIVDFINSGQKFFKGIVITHFVLLNLFFVAIVIDLVLFFPTNNFLLIVACLGSFALLWYSWLKISDQYVKLFSTTAFTVFALGLVMSTNFYPNLLRYQAGTQAGREISEKNIPADRFYLFNAYSHSIDFYSRRIVKDLNIKKGLSYPSGTYLYTDDEGRKILDRKFPNSFLVYKTYKDFKVTELKLPFLIASTRASELKNKYLLVKTK